MWLTLSTDGYPSAVTSSHGVPQWRARTVEIPDPGDLEPYLAADGFAWIRRGDGFIGWGVAERFDCDSIDEADAWWTGFAAGLEHATEMPGTWGTGPLAFGGFTFDPTATSRRSTLVVPRIILGRRKGRAWLTSVCDCDQPWAELPAVAPEPPEPDVVEVANPGLGDEDWRDVVRDLAGRVTRGEVEKVVLARSLSVRAASPLGPGWLVRRLSGAYPSCWTFSVDGMVGASPEMLVRREHGLVTSRVLAGTINRTGSESDDLALASALARSSKDLVEHEIAVQSVADALEPHCSGMNVPESPFVLELANVMHLASDVTGVALSGVSALGLAAQLHPTAAVCGTPREYARALIAAHEALDRGRYAGPVGWIDTAGDGEFAIALRCGEIDPDDPATIRLFAGCGIVAESDPAEELAESYAKLSPMLEALGIREG